MSQNFSQAKTTTKSGNKLGKQGFIINLHLKFLQHSPLNFLLPDPPDQLRFDLDGAERQVPVRVLLPGRAARQLPGPGHGRDRQGHGLVVREHSGGRGRVRREGDRLLHQPGQEGGDLRGRLGQDQEDGQEGGLRQDREAAGLEEEGQGCRHVC